MSVQPSETMRAIHEMARTNWQRNREQPTIGLIVGGLAEVPGADAGQMGWAVLGMSALLSNVGDEIGAGVKARAFITQTTDGFGSGALLASAVGCELIAKDEAPGGGALEVPQEIAARRPGVAANAADIIRESMGSPEFADDVLANARDNGRWAGGGMVSRLTGELPGLDLRQAGLALLTCGGILLHEGTRVGAEEATRGLFRTRRKAAEGMSFAGIALAGAVMALTGDACLARA
jgi:hypothetical protein